MKQNITDTEPCRMRNLGGSERGTCLCLTPKHCPNPPLHTPIGMMMAHVIDQKLAKIEELKNANSKEAAED